MCLKYTPLACSWKLNFLVCGRWCLLNVQLWSQWFSLRVEFIYTIETMLLYVMEVEEWAHVVHGMC